jgi:hypothetical protein
MKQSILIEYLKNYIELIKTLNRNILSIEEFIYENGKEFTEIVEVNKKYFGKMKECYKNALLLSVEEQDLFYCEGFATFRTLPLPLLHAWCVDKNRKVYDPTWTDGTEYYGVSFDREFVFARILKNKGGSIIDDWKHHWPLLSGKEKRKWKS